MRDVSVWTPRTKKEIKKAQEDHLKEQLRAQEEKDKRLASGEDGEFPMTVGQFSRGQSSEPEIHLGNWGKYEDPDEDDLDEEEEEIAQGHFPGSDAIRIFKFGSS